MRRFSKTILAPYIKASGYRRLCEIGSAEGRNIDRLLADPEMHICSIDPSVLADLVQKYAGHPRVRVHKGLSLDVLRTLDDVFDCIMIDGDHNWYTVFNELCLIHDKAMLAKNGTIFLHDVGWPYARRDMYYDRDTVPAEYQQPAAKRGIVRGVSALSADPARGINADQWNAVHEGGPRNGVLTAVEDFIAKHPGYRFFAFREEWGLGVLVRAGENRAAVDALQWKARLGNAAETVKSALKRASRRIPYARR